MDKKSYRDRLDAQMQVWQTEIERLNAKVELAGADARLEYDKQRRELQAKQNQLREMGKTLQDSSEDAWRDIKDGIDSAWNDMNAALKTAASRFK